MNENLDKRELNLDELDAVSGGLMAGNWNFFWGYYAHLKAHSAFPEVLRRIREDRKQPTVKYIASIMESYCPAEEREYNTYYANEACRQIQFDYR